MRIALERTECFIDFDATPNLIRLMSSSFGMLGFLLMLMIVMLTCACLGGFVGSLFSRAAATRKYSCILSFAGRLSA